MSNTMPERPTRAKISSDKDLLLALDAWSLLASDRIAELEAENARLREGLLPFAKLAGDDVDKAANYSVAWLGIVCGADILRASTLIPEAQHDTTGEVEV